ncbi:hypothetical protein ACFRCI_23700 [Streptomyces sp. NPDC056638]|uniref:hypothetical protein n=1 Tax=Streptomyces sp. NPDC056638 TaxID=3345887 RepID=UPI00367E12C4
MTTTRAPWAVRQTRKHGQTTVLYAALALSAPGEYALAQMAGWDARVAWLMPAVLSLYAAISASVAKAQKTTARDLVGTPQEAEAKRRSVSATWGALVALFMATAAQVAEHVLTTGATGARAWVVIIVSAVPPLVAAHVLHIDPPLELEAAEEELPLPEWVREELARRAEEPQEPAGAPLPEPPAQLPAPPVEEPQKPILRTYAEVADALDVAPETVRGWKAQGKVQAYPGPGANGVLVDLRECQSVKSRRPVGV